MDKDTIIKKVKAGEALTREENLFYLTEIVGLPQEKAEGIITINENTDEHLILD